MAPEITHYDWRGANGWGREAMLRFGPPAGSVAVVTLPLFEEANRTRAFAAAICRALAERGVASVLPDLPGQGESLIALKTVSLTDMRAAYAALVDQLWAGRTRTYSIAIRSGALLDAMARVHGRWHLAPQDGRALLRELTRIRQAATPSIRLGNGWHHDLIDDDGSDIPVEIAGNLIGPALLGDLADYAPPAGDSLRAVRLDTDPTPADRHVSGTPLWRRSEPDNDPALAALLADDIATWITACAA